MAKRFTYFKTLKKVDVPKQGGGGRQSAIHTMPFWPEFQEALTDMAVNGSTPFEAIELDLTPFEKEFTKAKIRKPMLAVLSTMRSLLKSLKLEKAVDINRRGDTRIFIVGNGKK